MTWSHPVSEKEFSSNHVYLLIQITLRSKASFMIFEKEHLYHIYNQGNNKQNIFYNRNNYLFFLKKVNTYILPYADIISWCLMPNHFHLMVLVNKICITHGATSSHAMNRTLNDSIAILLRSYTRAINKQANRSGSLFREATKAECVNCFKENDLHFIQSNMLINNHLHEKQYPQICFDYIHENPVNANLVKNSIDWEFSSAIDYAGLRNGKLINKKVANKYVDF
ncbi:MAG: hypothetical protein L3J34_01615 [Flavobacteriaceae bacterium]|nr:hypothetical protein [Flavobacteriaceae bacterium]